MSQTSFPSHTGPMLLRTTRRSASVRATTRWRTPAPRSNPSRTAYPITSPARMTYHASAMAPRSPRGPRPLGDDADRQEEGQKPDERVHPGKPQECEDRLPRHHRRGAPGRGPEEPVDDPRLAPHLGDDPPGLVGDVGEGQKEHED